MPPGDDDDLNLHASLSGDLAEALARVERSLQDVKDELETTGRAGERAGDRIEAGADDAAQALGRVERAAEGASDELRDTEQAARGAGRQLGDAGKQATTAAAGFARARVASDQAASALKGAERAAEGAAEALDDAGDEAATAGAKAGASAPLWDKLARSLERHERINRLWLRTQAMMDWDRWSAGASRFRGVMDKILNADYDKATKKVNKLARAFGGFRYIIMAFKIGAVITAIWAAVGAVSALGAGAISAAAGLGSLVAGFGAFLPVGAAAVVTMKAFKIAAEATKDELDSIKAKFAGVGNAIAQGGLRAGLDYLDKKIGKFAENVTSGMAIIGKAMGKGTRDVADYISNYETLKRLGSVWVGLGKIVERFGKIVSNIFDIVISLILATLPAAQELAEDIEWMTAGLAKWLRQMVASGKAAQFVTDAYSRLKYAIGIVVDFAVGLYRILRIGAQESRWMAEAIHDAAMNFRKWTESVEGENAIRDWFVRTKPAIKEAALLLGDIIKLFSGMATNADLAPLLAQIRTELVPALQPLADMLTGDLGPKLVELATSLVNFFAQLDPAAIIIVANAIIAVADGVAWMAENVPGAGFVLSMLLTMALLAGPIAKVAGWVMKLGGGLKWIGQLFTGAGGLSKAQIVIRDIGKGFWSWISKLKPVGAVFGWIMRMLPTLGRLLGRAFLVATGPIGWIILAVSLLVEAFIWCYQNVEWFRDGVDTALRAVGSFFTWLWDTVLWPVISAIWTGLKFLGAIIFTVLVAPFLIAWNILAALFTWLYGVIVKPIIDAWIGAWRMLGEALRLIWENVIKPCWDAIVGFLLWLWASIWQPTMIQLGAAWAATMAGLQWVWLNVLKPVWDAIVAVLTWLYNTIWVPIMAQISAIWQVTMTQLGWVWDNILKPVFDAIGAALGILASWFQSTVDTIGRIWDGLKRLLATPVNFLINTVWNQGILKAWNWAADLLGLPKGAPLAPIAGYATGGQVRGPGTGISDSIPALLSNGEHVWTAKEVAAIGGHERMLAMRQAAVRRADGGPIGGATGSGTATASSDSSWTAWLNDWIRSSITDLTDAGINAIPFRGPPAFMDIPRKLATKARDSIVSWAFGKSESLGGAMGGGPGGGAQRWAGVTAMALRMMGQAQSLTPVVLRRMNQESGGNPTVVNRWDSNWRRGTPSVGLMQVIGPTYAANRDPRRSVGPFLYGVSVDPLSNILASMRYALRRYKSLPAAYNRAGGYDSGGWLQPGSTAAWNGTGTPEAVLTAPQWRDMAALAAAADVLVPRGSSDVLAAGRGDGGGLLTAVRDLTKVIDERPPAMVVSSDEVGQAVTTALAQRDREQRLRAKYRYGG